MPQDQESPVILTPDQRLRVFVSSTLQELAPERAAAREAISRLRLIPVMFELGARPHPPRNLYRAYLDQSHIFVGIYWQRYGWVAPDMDVSGLEDEYNLAGDRPRLIYIKSPSPDREARLRDLLHRIQQDDRASYKYFSTSEELRDTILDDLALLLTEGFELARRGKVAPPVFATPTVPQSPATPQEAASPAGRVVGLPIVRTSLVGRTQEVAALRELLLSEQVGLVTLTGPGGSGKSRLAIEVARSLAGSFAGGVAFVSLAPVTDPDLVASAVADLLGVEESKDRSLAEGLGDYLQDKQFLLVLDNFEQVIEAAPLVSELLDACPRLKVLATSRAGLHVSNEREFPVPPLPVPEEGGAQTAEQLEQYDSVCLFIERAAAVKPGFSLTTANAPALAEICRRLDGLPLAIELAAARIKVLTPQAMLARLEKSLGLLTSGARDLPERQQTLRSTIGWSYDLLSEGEKQLFRRMSVFRGGCLLEAVDAVCNAGGDLQVDVFDGVASLVDKSLVHVAAGRAEDEEPRFTMLQTIREYAAEQLEQGEEARPVHLQHTRYFADLADEGEVALVGPQQELWLRRLDEEHPNLRAAVEWALATASHGDEEATTLALRLTSALWRYWYMHNYMVEGRRLLATALQLKTPADRPDLKAYRARALKGAGNLAWSQGDFAEARALHEASLAIYQDLGDKRGAAYALNNISNAAVDQGEYDIARQTLEESLRMLRELGDTPGMGGPLTNLAALEMNQGNYERAHALSEESMRLHRQIGDKWGMAIALTNMGTTAQLLGNAEEAATLLEEALNTYGELDDKHGIAYVLINLATGAAARGDYSEAIALHRKSLRLRLEVGHKWGVAQSLKAIGEVAVRVGQPLRAARLFGAAEAMREGLDSPISQDEIERYEKHLAMGREMVSSEEWDEAWREGRSLSQEEAVALALAGDSGDVVPSSGTAR